MERNSIAISLNKDELETIVENLIAFNDEDSYELTEKLEKLFEIYFYPMGIFDKPIYIYYIVNTINEHASCVSGYFFNLDKAISALEKCQDWYREKGTGEIYEVEIGLNKKPIKVYEK